MWVIALLLFASQSVEAATFYENVRYVQQSFRAQPQQRYYNPLPYPSYSYPARPAYQPYRSSYPYYSGTSGSNCLYRNQNGECMIEQYLHAAPYRSSYYRYDDDDDYYYYDDDDDDDYYYEDDDDDDDYYYDDEDDLFDEDDD